jgi:methylglutamate dehydrogenase subunit B
MRLKCPLCGERDHSEFIYRGDASVIRPDAQVKNAAEKFHDFVYLRDNTAGWHREHWYHEGGCRSWIVVERNTLTHEMRASWLATAADSKAPDSQIGEKTSGT